jgi:hypothetical protein
MGRGFIREDEARTVLGADVLEQFLDVSTQLFASPGSGAKGWWLANLVLERTHGAPRIASRRPSTPRSSPASSPFVAANRRSDGGGVRANVHLCAAHFSTDALFTSTTLPLRYGGP